MEHLLRGRTCQIQPLCGRMGAKRPGSMGMEPPQPLAASRHREAVQPNLRGGSRLPVIQRRTSMVAQSTIDIRGAIEAANHKFMAAFARADAAGMAALYTPDGQLLPTHSDFVSGTQAIQAFWQAVMDMGVKEAAL